MFIAYRQTMKDEWCHFTKVKLTMNPSTEFVKDSQTISEYKFIIANKVGENIHHSSFFLA